MHHTMSRMVGRGLDGPDTHLSIEHDADLFEDATGVYVGGHAVPHGPHPAYGLTVVLLRLFRAENLDKQLVLTVGDHCVGDVELERGEVSFMVAQVDAVEPDPRRVVDAFESKRHQRVRRNSLVGEPAPVQHEALISCEGVFELPMPGDAYRRPGAF